VLRESKDSSLRIVVPDYDVGVVALLAGGYQVALVREGEASNCIVVGSQEVLAMRVIQVAAHDAAPGDAHVVNRVRVQEDRVGDLAAEADGVVKFDHLEVV